MPLSARAPNVLVARSLPFDRVAVGIGRPSRKTAGGPNRDEVRVVVAPGSVSRAAGIPGNAVNQASVALLGPFERQQRLGKRRRRRVRICGDGLLQAVEAGVQLVGT